LFKKLPSGSGDQTAIAAFTVTTLATQEARVFLQKRVEAKEIGLELCA
jgi:hypothetical protein